MTYYSTVTTKGQITLPAELREKLKLSTGKKVGIHLQNNEIVIDIPPDIEAVREKNRAFMKAKGLGPITDEQVDEAVSRAAIEKYERSSR